MAGKKGGAVALQTEINSEEDWQKLLEKEGLIVVDVYSEWCGPCLGMVGNLKKLKLEIGSDYLHLAVAKSEAVDVLTRFRNKSEPTWMFISNGQLIHVMFGANAPKLMRTIQQQLDKELKCLKGEQERYGIPFEEMTEDEKIRAKAKAEKEEAERQREAKELADKLEDLKIKSLTKLARKLPTHTLVLYFPHMIEGEKRTCTAALKMLHKYDAIGLMIIDQQDVPLTQEQLPDLFYNSDARFPEKFIENISSKPCFATLLLGIGSTSVDSKTSLTEILGKVEEKVAEMVYGLSDENNPLPNTPASDNLTEVEDEVWPGMWTPLNYLSKAAAVKILFPSVVRAIGHEDDQLPPPMYVIIFEANRAREINEVIAEFTSEVQKVGYFDSMDPEVAKRVCRNIRELEKMSPEKVRTTKMVMSLAKTSSDPLLAFAQLNPLYISPDLKTGTKEAELFFPPDEGEEDEGMVEEEEPEDEEEDDDDDDEDEEEYGEDEHEGIETQISALEAGGRISALGGAPPDTTEISAEPIADTGLGGETAEPTEGATGDEGAAEVASAGPEPTEEAAEVAEGEESAPADS